MLIVSERKDISAAGLTNSREFTMKAGAHLMAVLSGLYTSPEVAVVREYLTNMYDATLPLIRSGKEYRAPILRMPTTLNPTIEFQDFGIGMDFDTVWLVYAEYGNSTKSNGNDEVGGFGLGSKTAFCYNDGAPWNIVATKDGVTNRFMAFVAENGVPNMTHLSSEQTGLPNGVTVSIPVKREHIPTFVEAAELYIPYFPIELVVEGMADIPAKPEYMMAGNEWGVRKTELYHNGDSNIIMGNVPYSISIYQVFGDRHELSRKGEMERLTAMNFLRENNVDMHVPIGAVDIVPSRDSLKYTPRTRDAIVAAAMKLMEELPQVVEQKVASAPTKWEKAMAAHTMLEEINLPESLAEKCGEQVGKLTVEVPKNVRVDAFRITDSGVCTPKVEDGIKEMTFRPTFGKNNTLASVVIVNDTKKPIGGLCRSYIRKHFTNMTYSNNRAATYGHTPCAVYAAKLPKNMTVESFTAKLEGFTNVLLASTISQDYKVPLKGKKAVPRIIMYQYSYRGSWDIAGYDAMNHPAAVSYYVPLDKEGNSRYRYTRGDMYLFKNIVDKLSITSNVYGIRSADVAKLDSTKWVNLEAKVRDDIIAAIKQNPKKAKVRNASEDDSYFEFATKVIPATVDGMAELMKVAKKSDSKMSNIEWVLANYSSNRLPKFMVDEINAAVQTVTVLQDDWNAKAKAIVDSNPMFAFCYDIWEAATYQWQIEPKMREKLAALSSTST